MALFVKFPGTTDHVATDDINSLDSDTSHNFQSKGTWANISGLIAITNEPDAGTYSGMAIKAVSVAAGDNRRMATDQYSVTAGETYAFGLLAMTVAAAPRLVRLEVAWFDSGGGANGTANTEFTDIGSTWTEIGAAWTAPALTFFARIVIWIRLASDAGDELWVGDSVIREGTDHTFIPSLDIVGTLDETIDPPAMPIVYAKGSPLTVGAGWAGDGYEYTRRDGVGGPVVCQFLPDDLP